MIIAALVSLRLMATVIGLRELAFFFETYCTQLPAKTTTNADGRTDGRKVAVDDPGAAATRGLGLHKQVDRLTQSGILALLDLLIDKIVQCGNVRLLDYLVGSIAFLVLCIIFSRIY